MQLASDVARRLRQLADANEVLGEQPADAVDQIVAVTRPVQARGRVADVMRHRRRARREDRDVGAAIVLELELRLHALAQLIVADLKRAARRRGRRILQAPRSARREMSGALSARSCSDRGSR